MSSQDLEKALLKQLSINEKLVEQNSAMQDELKKLRLLTENLQSRIDSLLRVLYGKKSEMKIGTDNNADADTTKT